METNKASMEIKLTMRLQNDIDLNILLSVTSLSVTMYYYSIKAISHMRQMTRDILNFME